MIKSANFSHMGILQRCQYFVFGNVAPVNFLATLPSSNVGKVATRRFLATLQDTHTGKHGNVVLLERLK